MKEEGHEGPSDVRDVEKAASRCKDPTKGNSKANRHGKRGECTRCIWTYSPKERVSRRPLLKLLCIDGRFTEDKQKLEDELTKHCAKIYDEPEEDSVRQERRNKRVSLAHCDAKLNTICF